MENDGYVAVQVGCADKRENLANKPELGHVAKASTAPKRFIREFRFSEAQGNELTSYNVGQEIKCDIFAAGDIRKKPLRQIITAAADGANCITSVEGYLAM